MFYFILFIFFSQKKKVDIFEFLWNSLFWLSDWTTTDWHVIFTIEKPLKVHLIFNFSLYFRSLISFFSHKILHFCIKVCDLKNWSWKMILFCANFSNLLTRILKKNFSVFKLIQSMPSYKMELLLINAVLKIWHLSKGYYCYFMKKNN